MNSNQEFRREGNDLYVVQRIGLVEALCGFQMTITHLDGRQLLIKYPPGKIIEPGKYQLIMFYIVIGLFILVVKNALAFTGTEKYIVTERTNHSCLRHCEMKSHF